MSRFLAVVGLAMRELWISFRLLAIVVVLVLAGLVTALLPALTGASAPFTYATALGASTAAVAATVAWWQAAERRSGATGWLAVRAVPRSLLLLGPLAAATLAVGAGLVPSALIAALAVSEQSGAELSAFAAALVACALAIATLVSIGLLIGVLLAPPAAALLAALVALALVVPALLGVTDLLPTGGLALLAHLDTEARPLRTALQASGLAVGLMALAVGLGVAAMERVEL